MTDKQVDKMISVLEKIEKHLQAIDWKFWELHQQFSKSQSDASSETPIEPESEVDELETLAEIISAPAAAVTVTTPDAVKHTLKYPSIEILK